jgi:hypothetical protein
VAPEQRQPPLAIGVADEVHGARVSRVGRVVEARRSAVVESSGKRDAWWRRDAEALHTARLMAEVSRRWRAWFPFDPGWSVRDLPPDSAAFDGGFVDVPSMLAPLRQALIDRGVVYIYELVDGDDNTPSCELEFADGEIWCSDHRRYWTDNSFSWLVHADGGETVTLTGADLIAAVEEGPPSWNDFRHVWRSEPS